MKFFHSIRWRLQLWHGLLLITVLTGFGFTAYQLQRTNQLRHIDQELQFRVSVLSSVLRQHGERPPPDHRADDLLPGDFPPPPRTLRLSPRDQGLFESSGTNNFYYLLWFRDGTVISSSAGAPANVVRPERSEVAHEVRMRGTVRELYHYTPPGECVLVGRNFGHELSETRRLAGWLFVAGSVVLGLGLAGGAWLAVRAIRPVQDISATAAKIAAGDLGQRIPSTKTESELGQLTAVLNSTFERLEAAFAQQTRFTSDAAHELRTPVSVILTQTQAALSRERSAEEYRAALEACQRAAQRMRRLAESLLQLARLDAHQEPLHRVAFDISKTAADCVELLRPLAVDRGIQIHCDLRPVACEGDPERLSQVITNLLTNSIQYNKTKGEIRVTTERHNGIAILTVADTGAGIPAEAIPHLFERFYRVDKARSDSTGRTGLGLAIAKAIVDEHGGNIEVSSRLGEGAIFSVRLPS